ncbi:hypothetical protein BDV23DRAFT_167441 [Aspergillus alliaceus]|uniref:Uncharacterized protein n=1 Tax=Petromyces alliaceus TaxID=209559 RepID=A0A5N7BQN0_PETAA|nr:hypothetical protein BDV23DRAFT_167441 [Aspergillus alliaceus]
MGSMSSSQVAGKTRLRLRSSGTLSHRLMIFTLRGNRTYYPHYTMPHTANGNQLLHPALLFCCKELRTVKIGYFKEPSREQQIVVDLNIVGNRSVHNNRYTTIPKFCVETRAGSSPLARGSVILDCLKVAAISWNSDSDRVLLRSGRNGLP